ASPSSGIMTLKSVDGLKYTWQATIMVTVNPANIPAGVPYSGRVNILSGGSLASLPVSVTVTSQPAKFTTSPSTLSFTWQIGSDSPAAASLTILSVPAARNFTANPVTNSGGK